MTDTRKVQLGTEVDPSGAQAGFDQVAAAATGMAQKVGQSAGAAGKAVDGIGEGGQGAAGKVDKAARSIIGSIERTTAALKAGERGSASYFETLAAQRGISADVLAPYLADLRKAEEAQRAARASLQGMGVSAAQTAAALRGVPAQFTDIVTSIASGQQPITVLLQQGGQLKDMFGGAGAAARALGGYVLGLVNPFTVAAAAAVGIGLAYRAGAGEGEAFRRTTILSGQAAGVTAGQLSDMAAAVRAMGAGTQGRAAEVLNDIAGSADIGAGNLQRFVAAALALEKAGGPAADKTAEAFRSLAKEPLQAALKLNESTNFLTRSTYEQIRALELQGRATEAAKVAQEAYAAAIEQRTPQLVGTVGYLETAWKAVANATKQAWDAVIGIGRQDTLQQQLDAVGRQIAAARQRIEDATSAGPVAGRIAGAAAARQLKALQDQQGLLQEQVRLEQRGAEAAAARLATVKASAQWDSESDKFLSKQAQQAREIARTEQLGLAAGKSRAEIEALIAKIRDKYTEKAGATAKLPTFKAEEEAARAYGKALDSLQDIQAKATAGSEGLSKTQAKLRDVQADPAWATYSRQQREQIITAAASAQAAEDQAASTKAAAKAAADAAKDYQQWIDTLARSGDAVARQVLALQDEEQAARIAATGRLSLKAAIEEVTIARLREQQVAAMGSPDAVLALQREIDERTKLRDLITGQDQRKAAEDTAKEWAKSAEKINDSITDALMRGFESGKGFAQSLRDTVVNMFKTMVLRPIISAIVNPIGGAISGVVSGALGSVLGMGATNAVAQAGLSAGTGLSIAGGAAGLGGLLGGAGAFGSGLASGLTAWGAGGSVTGLLGSGSAIFAGGAANGLGVLAGALGPIALGVGALAAIAKALDNGGTPHYGASSAYSAAGGLQLGDGVAGLGSRRGAYSAQVEEMTTTLAQTVVGILDTTASTFGKQVGYSARAAFADDKSSDPAQGALAILLGGQLVAGNNSAFQRYADGTKGREEYLSRVAQDVRTALNAIGLPTWAAALLDKLGASPSIEQLGAVVTQINATQAALANLGATLPQIGALAGDSVNALVDAFGGIDNLAQSAGNYLQALYTEAERSAITTQQLQAELAKQGASLPGSREAYRALIEAQDLSTDAGRRLYATLVQLAPSFAQVTEAVTQANATLQTEIDRLRGGSTQGASQAQLASRFSIATAQARAGDLAARQALPGLSQALEQAAQASAGSAADVARVRAWLASSLQQTITGVAAQPAGPAQAAQVTPAFSDAVTSKLDVLLAHFVKLADPLQASALSSARTTRLLERVMQDGDALTVRVAP